MSLGLGCFLPDLFSIFVLLLVDKTRRLTTRFFSLLVEVLFSFLQPKYDDK
jgi:hypothetical protein